MITITTTEKSVKIQTADYTWDIVKSRIKGQIPYSGGTHIVTDMGQVAIPFDGVTADGQTFTTAEQLQDWVQDNCFKAGGTGPGPEPGTLKSLQEEGKGLAVTNYLPITQEDFDSLAVKNPTTTYDIIAQYPTT